MHELRRCWEAQAATPMPPMARSSFGIRGWEVPMRLEKRTEAYG
jgi:hypothetical protein